MSITDASKIKIFYQISEDSYHARSFEDAFIKVNLTKLIDQKDNLRGLQNKSELTNTTGIYDLTEKILKKKSDFAFSLLYLALSKNIDWQMPLYIKKCFRMDPK
ncbi:hypothetical protein [Sulfurospirillum diekertiae]|uniref:hypothetical protein n=1 Tax=Sulfurospirillum diekertiae TaxID=1854492 RepID=UPI00192CFA18|nr:hypothetical protein [Sulfurospirillum diekertiae]